MKTPVPWLDDYLLLARRTPPLTNAEIAEKLGIKHRSMCRTLTRYRTIGVLTFKRRNGYHTAEIHRL